MFFSIKCPLCRHCSLSRVIGFCWEKSRHQQKMWINTDFMSDSNHSSFSNSQVFDTQAGSLLEKSLKLEIGRTCWKGVLLNVSSAFLCVSIRAISARWMAGRENTSSYSAPLLFLFWVTWFRNNKNNLSYLLRHTAVFVFALS